MTKILFLHGWTSVPGGRKPTYLIDCGYQVLNPALPDDDFEEAVRIAQAEFERHRPDVVVGSSRGGSVAMNIDAGDASLVLLCPAWKRWGTATTVKPQTTILHSRADDVVPFEDTLDLIRNSHLPADALVEVGDDHRLADSESLAAMAAAIEGRHATSPLAAGERGIRRALVQHRDQTPALDCPFGHVQRIVTGGDGGIANVHVVRVTKGTPHVHEGYDEVYYVLSGAGSITLGQDTSPLRPGSVAVIPAGVPHWLEAEPGDHLEFIIFGTPPMSIDDPRAAPMKVE